MLLSPRFAITASGTCLECLRDVDLRGGATTCLIRRLETSQWFRNNYGRDFDDVYYARKVSEIRREVKVALPLEYRRLLSSTKLFTSQGSPLSPQSAVPD